MKTSTQQITNEMQEADVPGCSIHGSAPRRWCLAIGSACHFIGLMMLLMEYLRRSESCCLPSIGHSVGGMGAAWAGGADCGRGGGHGEDIVPPSDVSDNEI
jgi:hypothetical protein